MESSRRVPALVRYPVAFGLALLAERLLLVVADDIGLLKAIRETPSSEITTYAVERIALCALLVVPALYTVDWLLQSRLRSIIIGFTAFAVALWFWPA